MRYYRLLKQGKGAWSINWVKVRIKIDHHCCSTWHQIRVLTSITKVKPDQKPEMELRVKILIRIKDFSNQKLESWVDWCQEATVRTGYGTTDWFQIGKGVRQGYILSPCLFNLYAEYIMRNAGLDEVQAGIKTSGRNINNLRYADDTTLMSESKEELMSLSLDESERGEWKSWLKTQHSKNYGHGIQSHHFMANR